MTQLPPRLPVTAEEIGRMVAAFYAAIRRHEVLGPVFAAHVEDWPAHETKIERFWRNAILHERGYDGSPMAAHLAAPEIRAEHFALWLALFDETAARVLRPEAAAAWSALAHRIGRSLRMAIEDREAGPAALPRLG